MAMEQTRMIGTGSHTGQSKVLDQARKRSAEGLVSRRLLGPVLRLPPGEDGRLHPSCWADRMMLARRGSAMGQAAADNSRTAAKCQQQLT